MRVITCTRATCGNLDLIVLLKADAYRFKVMDGTAVVAEGANSGSRTLAQEKAEEAAYEYLRTSPDRPVKWEDVIEEVSVESSAPKS